MNKLSQLVAALIVSGTSLSMANVTVDFLNASATRDLSTSGDIITLDFTINGAGAVTLDATPVGAGTDPEYLAAVEAKLVLKSPGKRTVTVTPVPFTSLARASVKKCM